MNLAEFIYAERGPARYYRHLVFWPVRVLYLLVTEGVGNFLLKDRYSFDPGILWQYGYTLGFEMAYTYGLAYYLLPRFFGRKQYAAFFALAAVCWIGLLILNVWMGRQWNKDVAAHDLSFLSIWGMFWGYTGYGPPAVAAVFVALKTIKTYIRTMKEKEALVMENAQAEALLLKAQVHPHFLFNTLNNIYSFSRRQPGVALELVENLSSTVRYMTTDCSAELVPLEKELKLIRDYVELERVRYGNRLDVLLQVEGECGEKCIDPLLLIPLVENCFKHGASQLLEKPWIKVCIFIEGLVVSVEISNNRPAPGLKSDKKGIGLGNVQKRLSLLHPGNHLLEILPGRDRFLVRMQLPLRATPYPLP
ncbi:MAG TPA: histidine kinase [Puia sp.]|uniref:sensor histidine kinase n=1 Tax=Puia sp. TaxID=2045100 RepID=UPI002B7EEA42|nr:histidine kinase [Puia sp.]HVU94381.1 histidine kinase [Puia sp.]